MRSYSNSDQRTILFAIFSILIFSIYSCTFYNEEELFPEYADCDTLEVSYIETIVPILEIHCYSCHSADNYLSNSPAPLLEGYENLEPYATSGILSGVINHTPGFQQMPRNRAKLPECEVAKIDKWILEGSNNN